MFKENEFLRKLRREQGIKAKDIALAIGKTPSFVCQVEKGKKALPRPNIMGRWVKALKYTPKYYEQKRKEYQEQIKEKNYLAELESILRRGWIKYRGEAVNQNRAKEMLRFKGLIQDIFDSDLDKYKTSILDKLCYLRVYEFPILENIYYKHEMRLLIPSFIEFTNSMTSMFELKKEWAKNQSVPELEGLLLSLSYSFQDLYSDFFSSYNVADSEDYPFVESFRNLAYVKTRNTKTRWTISLYIWLIKKLLEESREMMFLDHKLDQSEFLKISKIIECDFVEYDELSPRSLWGRFKVVNNKVLEEKIKHEKAKNRDYKKYSPYQKIEEIKKRCTAYAIRSKSKKT